jgi:polyisoprenyl-teichoic acid--peptidoglycan teichoic acid transferase
MMRHTSKKQSIHQERSNHPDNLLDLNRSLPNYAYHPVAKEDTAITATSEKHHRPWKKIILWIISIIVIVGLFTGGWVFWKLFANQIKVFGWGSVFGLFRDEKLKGEDTGHVNILLAGNSVDDAGHAGAQLTDSIMVLSINTSNKSAFMLSVPRDLYVNIPDNGYAKINEAYQDGTSQHFDEPGYAEGGMGLLAKTVSEHFGMPIHYYALVNYAAVRDAVNAVGGIDVTIDSSDPRGLYDPSIDYANNRKPLVRLPNGKQTIDGAQALGLARARGQAYGAYGYGLGDFERTKNQRLILLGLKNKAVSLSTLANPVKLGELFDSFGNNVTTDLSLGNTRRLYSLLKEIPDSSITSVGLNDVNDKNLLMSYTTRTGQSALVPRLGVDDFSEIQAYITELLNPPAPSQSAEP